MTDRCPHCGQALTPPPIRFAQLAELRQLAARDQPPPPPKEPPPNADPRRD